MEYSKYYSMIAVIILLAIIAVVYYAKLQTEKNKSNELHAHNQQLLAVNQALEARERNRLNEQGNHGFM